MIDAALALLILAADAPPRVDINTALIAATFLLQGPAAGEADNRIASGSGFVVGRRCADDPERLRYTLVTAAHVLEDIKGDELMLLARRRVLGQWKPERTFVRIREGGTPLYRRHPAADVAAIYIRLPEAIDQPLLPDDLVATQEMIQKYEIHPGDEILALGYPMGKAGSPGGFAILRAGRIASFPLGPEPFLMDMEVYGGNSGGPVYFYDRHRSYGGATRLGEEIGFLMGLVSRQSFADEEKKQRLALAVVVPGAFIRETLELLPSPTCR